MNPLLADVVKPEEAMQLTQLKWDLPSHNRAITTTLHHHLFMFSQVQIQQNYTCILSTTTMLYLNTFGPILNIYNNFLFCFSV